MSPSPHQEQLVNELTAMGYAIDDVRKADTFTPPEGVRAAARRALELIAEGHAGDGFTDVGRKRASDLAAGRSVSLQTVKRMRSYFARHEVDKQGKDWDNREKPSPGKVAWLAWGGDPGKTWADAIVRRQENIEKAYKRKYATRREAAQAAAAARWGNRQSETPTEEPKARKVDPVKTAERAYRAEAKRQAAKKNPDIAAVLKKRDSWLNAVRDNAPPPGEWRKCSDAAEAKAQWEGQGFRTEVHFGSMDIDAVNAIGRTWNELFVQFPYRCEEIPFVGGHKALRDFGLIHESRYSNLGTAYRRSRGISLNENYTNEQYDDFALRSEQTGFHPVGTGGKGDGVRSVLIHEFGHHLTWGGGTTRSIVEQVRMEAPAGLRGKSWQDYVRSNLSTYAAKNWYEVGAEAFSEYMMAKNPRPLARRIMEAHLEASELRDFSVKKAYKRKYATREEAARAAANARWGNRAKTDAPTTPAGPKIEPWVDQKTTAAVDKEFNRRWGNRTQMILTGLNPISANSVAETMNELLTLYPETRVGFITTQTGLNQVQKRIKNGESFPSNLTPSMEVLLLSGRLPKMAANCGADYIPQLECIRINKNQHDANGVGAFATELSETSRWFTPTGMEKVANKVEHSARRSIVHEFGHAIDLQRKQRQVESPNGNPIHRAMEDNGIPVTNTNVQKFVRENIGTYAATNDRELFAETFTEFHMSPTPRKLSVDYVDYRMKEIGKNPQPSPVSQQIRDVPIIKAYKRKYATRSEAARAAANARWGNRATQSASTEVVEWQKMESIDEINAAWNSKHGHIVPGGFDGMSVRFARQAAKGLDSMVEQYPDVAAGLSFVGSLESPLYRKSVQEKFNLTDEPTDLISSLPNGCYGGTSMKYGYIAFSGDGDDEVQDAFSANQFSKWVVPVRLTTKAGEYIAVHEFGHAVARHMGIQAAGLKDFQISPQSILDMGSDVAWERTKPMVSVTNDRGGSSVSSESISNALSGYGAANFDEAFAESWTEIHLSDSPRPYATTWVKGFAEGLNVSFPSSKDAIAKFVSAKRSEAGRKAAQARWGKKWERFGTMKPRERLEMMRAFGAPAEPAVVSYATPEGIVHVKRPRKGLEYDRIRSPKRESIMTGKRKARRWFPENT